MADASVRAATPAEAAAIAAIQSESWSEAYSGLLPDELLRDLGSDGAVRTWAAAIEAPPSPRHRVMVALAGDEVVGFASGGPADDEDLDPRTDAELGALTVAPRRRNRGHGSRLVNAAVDVLRQDGFARMVVWLTDAGTPGDERLAGFLQGAGWADDGARRTLDLHGDGSLLLGQRRLAVTIAEATSAG